MTEQKIPEGYMPDAQGNLVPVSKIKPEHMMEDELVRSLVAGAKALNTELGAFKGAALGDASAFREMVADKYGATKGGAKGNMTLRSFDGTLEVQVAVSDQLSFGPELQAAKELIDNCLMRWAEGSNENLHAIVNDAFNVGKEGRIDTKRVLGLRRLQIDDPEWLKAMDAISDAVRTDSSKTYIRFYSVDPDSGTRQAIPLDLAAV
jgi:hypothetical protein